MVLPDIKSLKLQYNGPNPGGLVESIFLWRFSGICPEKGSLEDQTMICGWDENEGPCRIWIGLEGPNPWVTLRMQIHRGQGSQEWHGPILNPGKPFDFQIAVHTGMGPGGVMYRESEDSPWSSLRTSSARGAKGFSWPSWWSVSSHQSVKRFKNKSLKVWFKAVYVHLEQ